MDDIETRMFRLERRSRRLQLLVGALVILGLSQVLPPVTAKPRSPNRIEVGELVVVDADGVERAGLWSDDAGVFLALRDHDGDTRIELRVHDSPDLASVRVLDPGWNLRAALGSHVTPGSTHALVTTGPASLVLYDPDGTPSWQSPIE